jgi:hypothetical protein
VNDVVAYDRMRDTAVTAFALLQTATRNGGPDAAAARDQVGQLRREVLVVDAFDRAAVDALAARMNELVRELEGRAS